MPEEDDPLAVLREQVRAATEAAARIAAAARQDEPHDDYVPPSGWASENAQSTTNEVQALASLLHTLKELLPPELQEQITELIRQVLIILRALIDWAVTRIERGDPGQELFVEDIPIS